MWGSMMGPFGGCFAMRMNLHSPVPKNFLVDDFYICMNIIRKGYKAVNNVGLATTSARIGRRVLRYPTANCGSSA